MDIGDPVIYTCPLCGKKMQMTTFTSYTVSSSKYFSDGYIKQSGVCCPDFTPDLAKCPYCKKLFFRHNVKDAETVNFYINKEKESIEDPDREDLVDAVKNKIFKKRQEEKELREMLWCSLNDDTRSGYYQLTGEELKLWQENCAVLLRMAEKTIKEMQSEKNSKKYNKDDIDSCLLMIAELNRNLGKFDKCMEIFSELGGKWAWLKKQFAWECKAKNIFTFQIMSKNEINLERDKNARAEDYLNRAQNFLPPYYGRRNLKKALADIQTALDSDDKDDRLYTIRGKIYEAMGETEAAENDKRKAQMLIKKKNEEWEARIKEKNAKFYKSKRKRKGKGISEL